MEIINLFIIIGGLVMAILSAIDVYNHKSKGKNITLIITGIILIILSIFKWSDDNKKEIKQIESYSRIGSLDSNLTKLISDRALDSVRDSDFEKKLFSNFNIFRDSTNNPKVYNNTVNNPGAVIFDQR